MSSHELWNDFSIQHTELVLVIVLLAVVEHHSHSALDQRCWAEIVL